MDGYLIDYIDNGSDEITWFGAPMSSMKISKSDNYGIIGMMFANAHPGCKITSIKPCTLEEFQAKYKKD